MTESSPVVVETPTADVLAAGTVLWRPGTGGRPELALVHRPRYDDWSFPKGKLDAGESMPAAAVRETAEETGWAVRLDAVLGEVRYRVPEGSKVVRYWSARAGHGEFVPNDETDELRWTAPERAEEMLSYRHDLEVLHRFTALGPPASVVALVRHAKAGSRKQWDGDDALRPLSGTGQEQARRLVGLLRLFGPERITSAPPLRCRDTVAPLAAALDIPVVDEPRLGEEGFWPDPSAGRRRFRELATEPGVTVLCSQGGVIPDVLAELVKGTDLPARKASTWLLTFSEGGDLRSADHYPHPSG